MARINGSIMISPLFRLIFPRAFAVLLAVMIGHYCFWTDAFWGVLMAILVVWVPYGNVIEKGVQRYIAAVIGVIFGAVCMQCALQPWMIFFISILVMASYSYFAERKTPLPFVVSAFFIFSLFFILSFFLDGSEISILYNRIFDMTLGGLIGVFTLATVFPKRMDNEFRQTITPVLETYVEYFQAIMNLLYKQPNAYEEAQKIRIKMDTLLNAIDFPIWVYESRVEDKLQKGRQHFLMMTERLGQTLISMQAIAQHEFDGTLLEEIKLPLLGFTVQAMEVLRALIIVMNLEVLSEGVSTLQEELNELEKIAQRILPNSLELLDISSDGLLLTAFLENIHDLQDALLRMGLSLRGQVIKTNLIT